MGHFCLWDSSVITCLVTLRGTCVSLPFTLILGTLECKQELSSSNPLLLLFVSYTAMFGKYLFLRILSVFRITEPRLPQFDFFYRVLHFYK